MNRLYILISGFLFCIPLYAQLNLPNADLEDWVTKPAAVSYEDPLHWSTSNVFTCSIGCGGGHSVLKSTSAYSGFHAAVISTVPIGVAAMPFAGFIANGKVTYDDMYMTFDFSQCGTPMSSRPSFISGFYKYNPWEMGDSALVTVYLTCYNPQLAKRDTIGTSLHKLGPASTYTYFKANIQYEGNIDYPDTIVAIIYSTDPVNPMEYAELTIDLLQAGGSNGIPGQEDNSVISIFPNPAIDALYLQLNPQDTPAIENIYITDINGRRVKTLEKVNKPVFMIPLGIYEAGCYIVEIQLSDGRSYINKFIKI